MSLWLSEYFTNILSLFSGNSFSGFYTLKTPVTINEYFPSVKTDWDFRSLHTICLIIRIKLLQVLKLKCSKVSLSPFYFFIFKPYFLGNTRMVKVWSQVRDSSGWKDEIIEKSNNRKFPSRTYSACSISILSRGAIKLEKGE